MPEGRDNSWNHSANKELERKESKWWFLERVSNKPILIEGSEVIDISDGICAYAAGPQIDN